MNRFISLRWIHRQHAENARDSFNELRERGALRVMWGGFGEEARR